MTMADAYSELRSILNDALADSGRVGLGEALQRMAAASRSIMSCQHATVIIRDGEGRISHFVPTGLEDDVYGATDRLPRLEGLLARVIYDGVTVRVPDVALEPGAVGLPKIHPRVRELLAVPVQSAGKVTGGLFLSGQHGGRPFRPEAEQGARVIATAIGFLVDHARMAEQIERRERWLAASNELTRELVADTTGNPMQMLVERILTFADVDLAAVTIPSADGESLVVTSLAGENAHLLDNRVFALEGSVTGHLFDDHRPLIVQLGGVTQNREVVDKLGLDTALMVPMIGLPSRGGVLSLCRYPGRAAFTQAEVEMATTFAAQMVLSMELARARAERERNALLAERDRIARDLHDNIIQQLFATGMALQSTASDVDHRTSEKIYKAIDELDRTILQIRTTIYRLSAPTLDDGSGLRLRIDQVVARLEDMLGFPIDIDISGPIDFGVSDEVGHDVLAVLQETLTNIAKHAEATSAYVSITLRESLITLVVADNGRGIGDSSRRSGLANLRSRAETLGGMMTTESGSNGTRITWSAPTSE